MFPIDVDAYDVSAFHVNVPIEVAGGVNISLHVHPLVMVRGDESGDGGTGGIYCWAADVHVAPAIWAGWWTRKDFLSASASQRVV